MSAMALFPEFTSRLVRTPGADIHTVVGPRRDAPALLLLHGYPQTHAIWHRVAPRLAKRFNVVATDLRGYGDSGKPPGGARQEAYSKREMARDQVEVMRSLGYGRFFLCGHDRGGRRAHRLPGSPPESGEKGAGRAIAPTVPVYGEATG